MLFPALGMTTAMWLLFAPLMGIESGARAELGVAVGAVALVASLWSVWSDRPRVLLVVLGVVLGFANFDLDASIGSLTSLATCAVALIAAGAAAWPVSDAAPATSATAAVAATTAAQAPARARPHDEAPSLSKAA